ncbi:histone-lysine N-methyltransferase SUV39H2 isoform X2 [Pleurodeles waltl]|uniref:histone-lysine N-methyltransferase SUV39H2 isoform X2 n=1 Tax=Pleurodeles waltl TaxID=8319 RepID=UPI003709A7ED
MAEKLRGCYVPCLVSCDTLQEMCRKEKFMCPSLGIKAKIQSRYEVEYLCDQMIVEGHDYYFVKWRGWPVSTNTWEPRKNLKCPLLLKAFRNDLTMFASTMKQGKVFVTKNSVRTLKPAAAEFVVKKAKQRIALRRWEKELNSKKKQNSMIFVENNVDLEGPPLDFHYIEEYKASYKINLNTEVLVGCDCSNCFSDACCPAAAGVLFPYDEHRRLKIKPGFPIFECNTACKCDLSCPNRVVQKGSPYSLCIFRTNNGRGWGVKTLQNIRQHSFVMEYVGECDPNLQVFNVFIENLDLRLPRIALFSIRPIKAGEELTFDYQMKGSGELSSDLIDISPARRRVRTACKCGSAHCRGYLN